MSPAQTHLAAQPTHRSPLHGQEKKYHEPGNPYRKQERQSREADCGRNTTDTEMGHSDFPLDHSVRLEDSMLFASLFQTTGSTPKNQDDVLSHQSQSSQLSSVDESLLLQSMDQQISGKIKGSDVQEMECTLLLPHLGEVRMNASQQPNSWHIQLTFMRPAILEYAKRIQPGITKRLSESLGSPVVLGLSLLEEESLEEESDDEA